MAAILMAIANVLRALGGLIFPALGGWVLYRAETAGSAPSGDSGTPPAGGAPGPLSGLVKNLADLPQEIKNNAGGGLGFLALGVVALAVLSRR